MFSQNDITEIMLHNECFTKRCQIQCKYAHNKTQTQLQQECLLLLYLHELAA